MTETPSIKSLRLNGNSPLVMAGLLQYSRAVVNMTFNLKDDGANGPQGYRVEISGWDADEKFFVEKSMLIWTEGVGKRVTLKTVARVGSVLFVRLIQGLGGGTAFPVAYRAVEFAPDNHGSGGVVTLEQLQPRMAFRESEVHFAEQASTLA